MKIDRFARRRARPWKAILLSLVSGSLLQAAEPELLEAAYENDLEELRQLLENGSEVNQKNRHGVTALALACRNGNPRMVELLLEQGADASVGMAGGETLLMSAARAGNRETCEILIKAGQKVDAKERSGQTALMWAAASGQVEVVDALLDAGADPELEVNAGFTALLFAVRQGHGEVVKRLIEAGVEVTRPTPLEKGGGRRMRPGTAPLMLAMENGHFELALELVEAGADPNDMRSGFAPLHALTWVRKTVRGDGANAIPPPRGSGTVNSLEFARKLVAAGADVNLRLKKRGRKMSEAFNPQGATPLLMAANTCDLPLMKLLVELGADLEVTNAVETPAVLMACGINVNAPGEEEGSEAEAIEMVAWLLEQGADINVVDRNGQTVMHGAAYKAAPELMRFLDEQGADIAVWNTEDGYGRTPLRIARGYRRGNFRPIEEMVVTVEELMRKHGAEIPPRGEVRPDTSKKGYGK